MSLDGWNRVPCSRAFRSPRAALAWWARWRAASTAAGLNDGAPLEARAVCIRPAGWGYDGRPRYAVEARRAPPDFFRDPA